MATQNDKPAIPRDYFEAAARVAMDLLGEEHPCSKALRKLLSNSSPDAIDQGMGLIRELPQVQRDQILSHAKHRFGENAKFERWLMKKLNRLEIQ
ncbi:MAG: hypothetical protein HYY65_04910 [Candidatus Tectomicrobia bacterium]|uniref:Uncharacterized protein n=1 Tax=Tectimicrobiota bacterium TaxID=2528274 RepID=A0A932GNH0_UNCTE|nr:hypothetical protein [Candidatus Tectomicrobia bacterium]